MKTIYRIEYSDGHGPFGVGLEHPDVLSMDLMPLIERWINMDTPQEDGLKRHPGQDKCGFASLEALHHWVKPEEIKTMLDNGYKVYRLEVDQCQVGRDNMVFEVQDVLTKVDISDQFIT